MVRPRPRAPVDRAGAEQSNASGSDEEPPAWDGPPPWSDEVEEGPAGRAVAAPARTVREPRAAGGVPDLHHVVGRWDAVVARVRGAGRGVIATVLSDVEPMAVTADGGLLLQLPNDAAESALMSAMSDVLGAVTAECPGIRKLTLRRTTGAAVPVARLTTESVIAERLATLKRRDPALDAAITALDLELLE